VLINALWGGNTRYRFALPDGIGRIGVTQAFRHDDSVGRWTPNGRLPLRAHVRRTAAWHWHSLVD
jgi:hypothetical protein